MKFVKRDYWDSDAKHRPYRNMVHEYDAIAGVERVGSVNPMNKSPVEGPGRIAPSLLDDLPDGTVFEVRIVPTGEIADGGSQLVEAHTYELVDEIKPRERRDRHHA